jgi:tetratricopeptide (TPR) repeat protein
MKSENRQIALTLLVFFICCNPCRAEKIYYKDGSIEKTAITSSSQNNIWVKNGAGSIGVDAEKIIKIENNDGSASKFNLPFLAKRVQYLIEQKNYTEAEKSCSLFVNISPNNVEARYLRAILNQRIGNQSKAAEDYNFLINHNYTNGKIFNNLGTIYAKDKKYKQAEDLFYKAIKENPDKAEFHNNLAELFLETKEPDHAINEYNRVLELEPDNTLVLFNLGVAYRNKGDLAKAKEQWDKVLVLKPDDAAAKNALGNLKI